MRKVLLSLFVVSSFSGYAAYQRFGAHVPADPLAAATPPGAAAVAVDPPLPMPPVLAEAAPRPPAISPPPPNTERTFARRYDDDDDEDEGDRRFARRPQRGEQQFALRDEAFGFGDFRSQQPARDPRALAQPVAPAPAAPAPIPVIPTAPAAPDVQVAANAPAYRDGTFKGALVDAYFGDLQVAAVISGGKLTDVQILTYPSDRSRSQRINQQALPRLKQEAITLQSAGVHVVSGATPTSRAFAQSLASALKNAT